MKNMNDTRVSQALMQRLEYLPENAARQWGKMNVSQMLAHCCVPIEVALGDRKGSVSFVGKLFGRFAKSSLTHDKPFKKGIPTDKSFIVADTGHFDIEKQKLLGLVKRFAETEPYVFDGRKHPFFGTMSYLEWSNLTYKHLDHHLRQFNG
ncbi:MAG: DUF1569 domain-containing protein [Sphingobacteriales bacterium]|nr:MAG: DUF1569 domain-containing protein [Sphingobacteriales bacterium]